MCKAFTEEFPIGNGKPTHCDVCRRPVSKGEYDFLGEHALCTECDNAVHDLTYVCEECEEQFAYVENPNETRVQRFVKGMFETRDCVLGYPEAYVHCVKCANDDHLFD